jgi:flagellar basal body-associated protein FliL
MSKDKSFSDFTQNGNENKRRKLVIIAIVLLLLLNGVLVYQLVRYGQELNETKKELITTEDIKSELESELFELGIELSDYKQEVLELDTALASRNKELQTMAEELQDRIRRHNISRQELAKAREELGVLRYYTSKYQTRIDSLERANVRLTEEKTELAESLHQEKLRSDRLMDEKVSLKNRVSLGERLEVIDLDASGVRYTSIGERERSTTRANRIERLRVCFTIDENIVARSGTKNMYVRILTPEGSTIHIQDAGSGTFQHRGEEVLYTMLHRFDYQNKEYSNCVYWNHTSQYRTGDYQVMLYADGHLIGENSFQVR